MTSTEIAPVMSGEVLDRSSGELIDLREASTDRLARFLDEAAELVSLVNEAKAQVDREVLRRMDAEASWTARLGAFELQAPSPEAGMTYYDEQALEEVLDGLVERGLVSEPAASAWRASRASGARAPSASAAPRAGARTPPPPRRPRRRCEAAP